MVIIVAVWVVADAVLNAPVAQAPETAPSAPSAAGATPAFADIAYTVDGTHYVLNDGVASMAAAPGSAEQDTLRLYQATQGDLSGSGENDVAVILINTTGGAGTFYYLAAALADGTTIPAVLLGGRIMTEGVAIQNGDIIVHYKDHAPGQPLSTAPTVETTAVYRIENGILTKQ